MDRLCHNCLYEGAKASNAKIHSVAHLDVDAYIAKIKEVRARNTQDTVLVVTEDLFSMDSDVPDLGRLQRATKEHKCTLVIDCAHSMFAMGKNGLGNLGDMIDDFSNVVIIGSGSKTLGSNFGYISSGHEVLTTLVRYYAPSFVFTNALPPSTCATVVYNINLLTSEEGNERRRKVLANAKYLREELTEKGYECVGGISPLVIVLIRSEIKSRAIANFFYTEGVICNSVEYPAVPLNEARLRLQLQPDHTKENLDHFVNTMIKMDPVIDDWIEKDNLVKLMMNKVAKALSDGQAKL